MDLNRKIGKYLTLEKATFSATAKANNLSNIPSDDIIKIMNTTAEKLYDMVYHYTDGNIRCNSFYRSEEVNSKIKGSSVSSDHMYGKAIDISKLPNQTKWTNRDIFMYFYNSFSHQLNPIYNYYELDQLIWETDKNNPNEPRFVHVSYRSTAENRGETKNAIFDEDKGIVSYSPEKKDYAGGNIENKLKNNPSNKEWVWYKLPHGFSSEGKDFKLAFPESQFDHSKFDVKTLLAYNGGEGDVNQIILNKAQPEVIRERVMESEYVMGIIMFNAPQKREKEKEKETYYYKAGTSIKIKNAWKWQSLPPQKKTESASKTNSDDAKKVELEKSPILPFVYANDIPPFYAANLAAVQADPKYKVLDYNDNRADGRVRVHSAYFEVWIWFRSLDRILNVTNFVTNLTTSGNKQNGQFSFNLAHINKIDDYKTSDKVFISTFTSKYNIGYWNKYLNINDLVFIKFEQLQIKEDERRYDFIVGKERLGGQIYDMLGLIDNVSENKNMSGLEYGITVSGRDYSKVFYDDEAVFFPLAVTKTTNEQMILGTSATGHSLAHRTFSDGKLNFVFAKTYQKIGDIFRWWISLLSNMGIIPVEQNETFFSSYIDDPWIVYRQRQNEYLIVSEVGAQQFNHKNVTKRRVQSAGIEGLGIVPIEAVYYNISDRREYREAETTTTENNGLTITQYAPQLQNGIYQIIKLTIDENIKNRVVIDASVGNPTGSFVSMFNKICQYPLVECLFDTYLDEFHIMVRQPPFNENALLNKENGWLVKDGACINIEDNAIKSTELNFNQEIYTWFQLEPKGIFMGNDQQIAMSYIPVIILDEYVNIWGSKRLNIVSNYTDYKAWTGSGDEQSYNEFRHKAIEDLLYLVQISAYLPFTRTGRIELCHTDRRIKKGCWIRLKYTNEIYYVDAVSHYVSTARDKIDASTILQVSRGMVEDYVKGTGKSIGSGKTTYEINRGTTEIDVRPTYFNIVDIPTLSNLLHNKWYGYSTEKQKRMADDNALLTKDIEIKGNIVNKNIFNFFLSKKQFE